MDNPFNGLPKWGKIAVIAGGGLVAFYVYRNHQASASASTSSTTASTASTGSYPPDGTTGNPSDPYSTDPATGQTYGDEQFNGAGAYGAGYGEFSGYNSGLASSQYYTQPGSGAVSTSNYTSNSAWAQAVETGLSDIGYSPTDVSGALGAWMAGQNLTPSQASIVQAAIAEFGDPPSGSYPILRAPTSTPGGGSGGGTTPPPVTTPKKTTSKPGMPTGVSETSVTTNGFHVIWHAVTGATSYRVRVTYQSQLVFQGTTAQTSINVTGLKPNQTYTVHVAASNSAGMSAETNGPAVKTAK